MMPSLQGTRRVFKFSHYSGNEITNKAQVSDSPICSLVEITMFAFVDKKKNTVLTAAEGAGTRGFIQHVSPPHVTVVTQLINKHAKS